MGIRVQVLVLLCFALALCSSACSGSRSDDLDRTLHAAGRDAEAAARDEPPADAVEPEVDASSADLDASIADAAAEAPEASAAPVLDAASDAAVSDAETMDATASASDADAAPPHDADASSDAAETGSDADLGDAACPHTRCVDPALLGGRVYFSELAQGGAVDGKIWLLSGSLSQIAPGEWPRVSPDGHYLLLHRGQQAISRSNIYRRDLSTGDEIIFFGNNDYAVNYDFSNDSATVYLDYYCEIDKANTADTSRALLFNGGGCYTDAPCVNRVSGDIAYHSNDGLHLMNAQGGNSRPIPNTLSGDYWPSFSHDGAFLAFCRNGGGTTCAYYRILPSGEGLTRIGTTGPLSENVGAARAAFTPDGSRLLAPGVVNCLPALQVFRSDGSGYEGPVCGTEGMQVDFVGDVLP